jgi:hypothetical protein
LFILRHHHATGGAIMEQSHLEILREDIRSKFELVLEGHSVLNAKIDAFRAESNEKHEQTTFLLKAVAADLSAHRADTEAHPLYQVREPSP